LQELLGLKDTLGALVSDIEPNSPAVYAGLKSGDLVVKYDGKKIKDGVEIPPENFHNPHLTEGIKNIPTAPKKLPSLIQINPGANGTALKTSFETKNVSAKKNAEPIAKNSNARSILNRVFLTSIAISAPPKIKKSSAKASYLPRSSPRKIQENSKMKNGLTAPTNVDTREASPRDKAENKKKSASKNKTPEDSASKVNFNDSNENPNGIKIKTQTLKSPT